MAPQRRPRHQPPELMAEIIEEILLRIPPDDPAVFARASAVCKPWRHILTDTAFRRRYSLFHQTPTPLGFLHNLNTGGAVPLPRFVPTLTPSPFPHRELDGCHGWRVLDCRHGRVLFEIPGEVGANLVIWNAGAATGERHWLSLPEPHVQHWRYTASVLCAAHVCGCDHLTCHGGAFLIVLTGFDPARNVLVSQLYSSEAGAWTAFADLSCKYVTSRKPSALIGDDVYFVLVPGHMVLRYNLSRNSLFIMHPPAEHEIHGGVALVPMEDGSLLGLAGLKYSKLYLWSKYFDDPMVGCSPWVQCRIVELRTLIPFAYTVEVVGCVERLGTIIVATDVGVFTVELKSGRERKVAEAGEYYAVFPVMSCFYTPGCASSRLPSPAEAHQ